MKKQFAVLSVLLSTLLFSCHDKPVAPAIGTVAFVNRIDTTNHVYLMDISSDEMASNIRRLTNDAEAENYPSWSPDGSKLTYQRSIDGIGIYIINADGTGQQRLSPVPGYDFNGSWSPDGKRIVFVRIIEPASDSKPPLTEIHIMNADGSNDKTILKKDTFNVEPRWSVKNQIVFMHLTNGFSNIYVMDTLGQNITQLTASGNNGDPAWSPDGTKISFGSDREGGGKLNIFTMNPDGTGVFQLTQFDVPDEAGDTNWSSDGKRIVFEFDINGKKQSDPTAVANVQVINADGTGYFSTTQPCSDAGCAPRWRPMK